MDASETKKRGRPGTDTCPGAWLKHLRAWCEQPGASALTRVETVPWGRYETMLDLNKGKVLRWYRQAAGNGRGEPQQLTRTDYLRLCPLLAAWHEYEPPTVEWQIL